MITGGQIRAARAGLGLTGSELSKISGVSLRALSKIEGFQGLPDARVSTLVKIKDSLEAAGIEFIGTPEDGPGIRIHAK